MKRTVTFFLAMALILTVVAFKTAEEKKYSVSYTEPDWNSRFTWIAVAKSQLLKSNLPVNEVKPLTDSLDKFMTELQTQLIPQIKPPVADSTKNKR